jgi:tryptophanyl-tRNA synthetase
MPQSVFDLAVSFLAVGLDPESAIIFVQSDVHEHTELAWLFNAVTPVGELERMTQYKDKSQRVESVPAGLLNYPVLQAADILLYKAEKVPVGDDQLQHLELAREIARRFNSRFKVELFPEPQPMLTTAARIVGLDGQAKMSKSLGNTIGLLDSPDAVWEKLRPAMTDPARKTRKDPGNPDVCNIYSLHQHFSRPDQVAMVAERCRSAGWGCLDCKRVLADNIIAAFAPIRERAAALTANPGNVRAVLADGARRARREAQRTMEEVARIMGFLRPAL